MPKYIYTKIRKLDNGDIEVVSRLNLSFEIQLDRREASPETIEYAKQLSRARIINDLFGKTQDAAREAFEIAIGILEDFPLDWRHLESRRKLESVFEPLLNAGKWLEEDAEDAGIVSGVAGEELREGEAVYRHEDGSIRAYPKQKRGK